MSQVITITCAALAISLDKTHTQISGRFTSWFKFVRLERALFVYAVGLNSECKLHKPVGDHRIYIEFAK